MTVLRLFQRQFERFFPFHCQICGSATGMDLEMCQSCREKMPWILNGCASCGRPPAVANDTVCGHCHATVPHYSRAVAVFRYETEVKGLVTRMKFHRHTASVRLLADLLSTHIEHSGFPQAVIVPVPLHPSRIRKRGYNQSAELAKRVSRNLGWPIDLDYLIKTKPTVPQVGLSGAKRRNNLRGVFETKGNRQGQKFLLIDDVITTDSTTNECAKALIKAGAEEVYVAAVARTLK